MIEQEIASIIKFVIDSSGNPYPYYRDIPEGFLIPAVYFPVPEVESGNDTLNTYILNYIWYINFFHKDTPEAFDMARNVLNKLKENRNKINIINDKGIEAGKVLYIKNTKAVSADKGAAQLTIEWNSRRPYTQEAVVKMREYFVNKYIKSLSLN